MRRGLEALRSELLKKRFGVGRKPRRVRPSASEPLRLVRNTLVVSQPPSLERCTLVTRAAAHFALTTGGAAAIGACYNSIT
jgi:hypothetical protein